MISVIVPIYNVEDYLEKCIVSIQNQTYKEIEIILVDDGSPDNCGRICDEYAKTDTRIKVIHKVNGGLSDARNAGISYAVGQYIVFVDADDYIHPQMLEVLYHNLIMEDADISVCGFRNVIEEEKVLLPLLDVNSIPRESFCDLDIMEQLEYNNLITVVAWNKLYRRKLFLNLRYPKGKVHEDEFIIHQILHLCKKVVYTKEKLYYYLQRKGSITEKIKWNYVADGFSAYLDRVDFLEQYGYDKVSLLTKIQILHYITKNYDQLANVSEASELLNKFCHIFKMYYNAKEVQNSLYKDNRILYKYFIRKPDKYYRKRKLLEKRREYLVKLKKVIKKCLMSD